MNISLSHDHVGISLTRDDLDATIGWYRDKLGFTVASRFETHGTTLVFLVNGNAKIELMAGATTRQRPTTDVLTSMDPAQLHHVCLAVKNLDDAITELGARDVQLIGGPMQIDQLDQRIAFIPDYLGNIIELAETTLVR